MNKFTYLIALLIFISSCTDRNKEPKTISNHSDSKEDSLLSAIKNYPDSPSLKETLIFYYRDNGNYDNAINLVNNMLSGDSSNSRLWDLKATLHLENDDTTSAIHAYEKAVRVSPGNPLLVMTLGSLYAETRDPRALDVAEALIHAKDAHAEKEGIFIKGLFYSFTGEKQKSIGFFDKSIELDYTFMLAHREKGIALYDLGKYEQALEVFTRAISVQNSFDEGYYWMGRCLEKLNRTEEAIESYRTALAYDADYVEARDALGRLGVK